ncbi:hypothetical protein Bbelb_132170 [Branchiostoma belcheri]|nr:hypothetical protein Bbelb_132170 [Branchiostoma belcheri]
MAEDLASEGLPMGTTSDFSALVECSSGHRPNANHTKVSSVPKTRDANPVYTQRTENANREENNQNPRPMYVVNANRKQDPTITSIYNHEHACLSGHIPSARSVPNARDINPVYTQRTEIADRTHQENNQNPSPLCALKANPKQKPSITYSNEHACSSGHIPNARSAPKSQDSNPVYTQSTMNADGMNQRKTSNPSLMYTRNAVNTNTTCPTVECVEEDSSGSHYYANNDDNDDILSVEHVKQDNNICVNNYANNDDDILSVEHVEQDNNTSHHNHVDDEDKPVESDENGRTVHTACDDVDIQPYAVAHMCADQEASATSSEATQKNEHFHGIRNAASKISRNVPSNLAGTTDEAIASDIAGDNRHGCHRKWVVLTTAIVLVTVLITAGIVGVFSSMDRKDTQNFGKDALNNGRSPEHVFVDTFCGYDPDHWKTCLLQFGKDNNGKSPEHVFADTICGYDPYHWSTCLLQYRDDSHG